MCLDNALDDGQPEPAAGTGDVLAPVKAFKNVRHFIIRNAKTTVGYPQLNVFDLLRNTHLNLSTNGCKFERVVKQVGQRHLKLVPVKPRQYRCGHRLDLQINPFFMGHRLERRRHSAHQLAQLIVVQLQLNQTTVQPREF